MWASTEASLYTCIVSYVANKIKQRKHAFLFGIYYCPMTRKALIVVFAHFLYPGHVLGLVNECFPLSACFWFACLSLAIKESGIWSP